MQKKMGVIMAIVALVIVAIISVKLLPTNHPNVETGIEQQQGEQAQQGITSSANVPHKLGGFDLVALETGVEAVENISRLHGTGIDIVDGILAQYATEESTFMLWISESRDAEEAKYLFNIMDEKIPNSQMFLNRTEVEVDGNIYIYVTGAGMENYYWADGTKNYWVGVIEGDDTEIIQLVVENFQE